MSLYVHVVYRIKITKITEFHLTQKHQKFKCNGVKLTCTLLKISRQNNNLASLMSILLHLQCFRFDELTLKVELEDFVPNQTRFLLRQQSWPSESHTKCYDCKYTAFKMSSSYKTSSHRVWWYGQREICLI